ncbi:hypothetical protein [Candidatus Burkholderia verschuerenii]|uniref:hypothetical protein n=1 Tax=Candidatus Burkholderia verschuerenii TaxID=242163 RepID=UPI000A89E8B4|nr:hypothetical protein [Candidatus Burkholderia verschuerenii]
MSATLPSMQTAAKPARRRDLRWLLVPAVLFLGLLYVLSLLDLFRISFNWHTLWANYARVFSVSLYWDSLVRARSASRCGSS